MKTCTKLHKDYFTRLFLLPGLLLSVMCSVIWTYKGSSLIKLLLLQTSVVRQTDIPLPGRKPVAIIISVKRSLKGLLNGFIWIHCASAMSVALGQSLFSTCSLSAELLIRSENRVIGPSPQVVVYPTGNV